ncbi:unnamed protein product [Prunus armeniaca]|uniref:Uncharacterized protein n=1 Tax=Prunus armeniaca TaxID=36596 RepID=A0A6J5TFK1_PRUAR|nr:unnamed protein product [Prunus armeniaca]
MPHLTTYPEVDLALLKVGMRRLRAPWDEDGCSLDYIGDGRGLLVVVVRLECLMVVVVSNKTRVFKIAP